MTGYRVQTVASLAAEMRQGHDAKTSSAGPAEPRDVSIGALVRLLTPQNRLLLRTIREARPQSIAELERLTGRKGPNLLRTLGKLAAVGVVHLQEENRRTVPTIAIGKLRVEIDPCAPDDRVDVE